MYGKLAYPRTIGNTAVELYGDHTQRRGDDTCSTPRMCGADSETAIVLVGRDDDAFWFEDFPAYDDRPAFTRTPHGIPVPRVVADACSEISYDLENGSIDGYVRDDISRKGKVLSTVAILATGALFILEAILLAL